MYVRHNNTYVVGATRGNPNVPLIFEYLIQKIRILKSYFGNNFTDEDIQDNFTLVYELFDETMDYGYPQNCAIDVLRLYINLGSVLQGASTGNTGSALTSQITGAIDWRREGIRYRKNEVFIDIHETISLLTSMSGVVLRSEILGKVMMNAKLTGMPECKFGLNDKLIMEKEGGAAAVGSQQKGSVEIDDCTFHRCVRLGKFDQERTITFIPPDGEFELMKYRVTSPSQPFRLFPNISEEGKTKLIITLKVNAEYPENFKADFVIVKIPVPPTTASARITTSKGRAKYEPAERALVWKLNSFVGGSEANITAVVELLPATKEKPWVRPPISMDFQVPMLSNSGVEVRFLKVYEKSSYNTNKWVKYMAKAGEYQVKI
jgi:AP-2 complex subunit mu-1